MSIISLGSVFTNLKANQTDYYIGSIINSESGFLIPKVINSIEDLDAFYGKFDYSEMYKSFIQNNIPICLLPIVTPLSNYNRSSLRISNGPIQVSRPKYQKDYAHRPIGNLHMISFFSRRVGRTKFDRD